MENESGIIAPRPARPPGGRWRRRRAVFRGNHVDLIRCSSRESAVFPLTLVCTVCSTSKLVGLVSLMTVSVPSPCELNASIVAGLKAAPSTPPPIGRAARILPSSA